MVGVRASATLLDLVYPPRCSGCGTGIRASEQPLCARCMGGLERVDPEELRAHVLSNVPSFAAKSVFALWMFDKGGMLQRAQHQLKFGRRPTYGIMLGIALGQAWRAFSGSVPDRVVPIPLHRVRFLERGYNQSAMLSEGVARSVGAGVNMHALWRAAPTRRQTGLTREERSANVRGVFRVRGDELTRKHVLVVDDVITTGATASAVVDALLVAGVRRVDFAALAHART